MKNTGSLMRTTIDDLTERIQLLSAVYYRNAQGDILKSEEIVRAEIWAKVLPISAPIVDGQTERQAEITYRVIVRYRDDLLPDDVVQWRGRRFKITNTPYDVESRRIWTAFECREVVPDGKTEQL